MFILISLFFISMVVNSGAAVYTVLALTNRINFAVDNEHIRYNLVEVGVVT